MADALVALHSTDAATVYLSALARLEKPDTAEVERALYDDRTLVRMHGMRQTLFVVPADLAAGGAGLHDPRDVGQGTRLAAEERDRRRARRRAGWSGSRRRPSPR